MIAFRVLRIFGMSVCLSIYLSVCLSVYLSIYLSIYTCIHLYLHIYMHQGQTADPCVRSTATATDTTEQDRMQSSPRTTSTLNPEPATLNPQPSTLNPLP